MLSLRKKIEKHCDKNLTIVLNEGVPCTVNLHVFAYLYVAKVCEMLRVVSSRKTILQ